MLINDTKPITVTYIMIIRPVCLCFIITTEPYPLNGFQYLWIVQQTLYFWILAQTTKTDRERPQND